MEDVRHDGTALFVQRREMLGVHYAVYMGYYRDGKIVEVATSITMETHNPATNVLPVAELSEDAVRRLMDELWRAGVRPSDWTGGALGEMQAMKRHLEDMRVLAFERTGVGIERYATK